MSIATVVTRGFGSFGSVNKLPTLGYTSVSNVNGPVRIGACEVFIHGAQSAEVFVHGAQAISVSLQPGVQAAEVNR